MISCLFSNLLNLGLDLSKFIPFSVTQVWIDFMLQQNRTKVEDEGQLKLTLLNATYFYNYLMRGWGGGIIILPLKSTRKLGFKDKIW